MTTMQISATQVNMLTATVKGIGGYKKTATKDKAIVALLQALITRFPAGRKAEDIMTALAEAEDFAAAQTILAASLSGADAIATEGASVEIPKNEEEAGGDVAIPRPDGKAAGDKDVPAPAKKSNKVTVPKEKKEKAPRSVGAAGFRDMFLVVKPGVDPYREGTLSAKTYAMMKEFPRLTFREYIAKGARANTILDAKRRDIVFAYDVIPDEATLAKDFAKPAK